MNINLQPVGILHSPYREKFIVPRQPGLVPSVCAELKLSPPFNRPEAVRELEQFSHLWLIFLFHQTMNQKWQPTVRPPRLGGNKRVGVFASRSPFRPNPIGLSAVELSGIRQTDDGPVLELKGIDLIDGTPILDIKPYIPYTDSINKACGGFADQLPAPNMRVTFTEQALRQLDNYRGQHPQLQSLIIDLLATDPRPAYRKDQQDDKEYGTLLYDYNLRWRIADGITLVTAIDPA